MQSFNKKTFEISIVLLDSTCVVLPLQKDTTVSEIIELICSRSNIQQQYLFGFYVVNSNKPFNKDWFDVFSSLYKQLKIKDKKNMLTLHMGLKIYPRDPTLIENPECRYTIFLQICDDLKTRRINLTMDIAVELLSLIAQSLFGDYSVTTNIESYTSEIGIHYENWAIVANRVISAHKLLKGTNPVECEYKFLDIMRFSDQYGVLLDKRKMMDESNIDLIISPNNVIINNFRKNKPLIQEKIRWENIMGFDRDSKTIKLRYLSITHNHKPLEIVIKYESKRFTTSLYNYLLEQLAYYRYEDIKNNNKSSNNQINSSINMRMNNSIPTFNQQSSDSLPTSEESVFQPMIESNIVRKQRFNPKYMVPLVELGPNTIKENMSEEENKCQTHSTTSINSNHDLKNINRNKITYPFMMKSDGESNPDFYRRTMSDNLPIFIDYINSSSSLKNPLKINMKQNNSFLTWNNKNKCFEVTTEL